LKTAYLFTLQSIDVLARDVHACFHEKFNAGPIAPLPEYGLRHPEGYQCAQGIKDVRDEKSHPRLVHGIREQEANALTIFAYFSMSVLYHERALQSTYLLVSRLRQHL
jgi:hypothetical protein